MPDTDILIVSYRTPELIDRLLGQLERWAPASGRQVWIVDNGAAEEEQATANLARTRHGWAHLIVNQANVGFARAVNQGFAASRGEAVLLLNSDARIEPESLERLEKRLADHPRVGVVGPRVLLPDGSTEATRRGELSPANVFYEWSGLYRLFPNSPRFGDPYRGAHSPEVAQEAPFLKGSCLLVRRQAYDTAGGFDERFFMYCEEADFCRRLRDLGWIIQYEPAAQAHHDGGVSAQRDPMAKHRQVWRSLSAYLEKHYGANAARRAKTWVSHGLALRAIRAQVSGSRQEAQRLREAARWVRREG